MFGYEVRRTTEMTPDGQYEWVYHVDSDFHIPYHSKKGAYDLWRFDYLHDDVYDDAEDAYEDINTGHFSEWIAMSDDERKTIRRQTLSVDTRRETLLNITETFARGMMISQFVTFPGARCEHLVTHTTTNTKEENNMTEFHTERTHLERDLRKSYADHVGALRTHHHMDSTHPETIRQALQMVKDGKFDHADDDKWLDRKWAKYDGNPLYEITLREKPVDPEGFAKACEKLDEAYRAHGLKVQVHEPKEALKHVEEFRKATFH